MTEYVVVVLGETVIGLLFEPLDQVYVPVPPVGFAVNTALSEPIHIVPSSLTNPDVSVSVIPVNTGGEVSVTTASTGTLAQTPTEYETVYVPAVVTVIL